MRNPFKVRIVTLLCWVALTTLIYVVCLYTKNDTQQQNMQNVLMKALEAPRVDLGSPGAVKRATPGAKNSPIFWQDKVTGGILRRRSPRGQNVPPMILHSKIEGLRKRNYPGSPRRDTCNRCYPYTYLPIIEADVCHQMAVELLILITTTPKSHQARQAIRKTWGSVARLDGSPVRVVFLLGTGWDDEDQKLIQEESQLYGDVQQDDYIDSYYNLSTKVIGGYHWVMRKCPQAKFILRTAEDNYINIPRALDMLRGGGSRHLRGFFGECGEWYSLTRDPNNKWYITRKEFPADKYPPYCVGTAFYVSKQTMMDVIKISPNIPYFPLEDVYFGLLAKYGLKYPNIPVDGYNLRFNKQNYLTFKGARPVCHLVAGWHHLHPVEVPDMHNLWRHCQEDTNRVSTVR